MGAEFLIQLQPGERRKVIAWYKSLPEEPSPLSLIISPETNKNQVTSWIWLEFPLAKWWGKDVVALAYSFGGQGCNGEVAVAVGAELMKHVKAKRWGWDSVGWLSVEEMRHSGAPRPFRNEIRRAQADKKYAELLGSADLFERAQKQLEDWAANLFKETWK